MSISIYSNVETGKLGIIKDSFLSHKPYIQSSPGHQPPKSSSYLPLLLCSYCWLLSFFQVFITSFMNKTPACFTGLPDCRVKMVAPVAVCQSSVNLERPHSGQYVVLLYLNYLILHQIHTFVNPSLFHFML